MRSVSDLTLFLPDWTHAPHLGQQILDVLQAVDAQWKEREAVESEKKRQKTAEDKANRAKVQSQNMKYQRIILRLKTKQEVPLQQIPGELSFAAYVGKNIKLQYVRIDPFCIPVPPNLLKRLLPSEAPAQPSEQQPSDQQDDDIDDTIPEEDAEDEPKHAASSVHGLAPSSYLVKHPEKDQYYVYAPSPLPSFPPEELPQLSDRAINFEWQELETFDYKIVYY